MKKKRKPIANQRSTGMKLKPMIIIIAIITIFAMIFGQNGVQNGLQAISTKINNYNATTGTLMVGDYVNYSPTESTYTVSKNYSGYTSDQSLSTETDLGWRVLNINDDGTVDLISAEPTTSTVYFQGANGYNNGVYLLNEMCSTLYSNSSKGATARSLNIEDIQDKISDKTLYTSYKVNGVKYGTLEDISESGYTTRILLSDEFD